MKKDLRNIVWHLPPSGLLLQIVPLLVALMVFVGCNSFPGNVSNVGDVYINSIGMKLAYVPPGQFLMGSPPDEYGRRDNEQQHVVIIDEPYLIGVTEVTQGQWLQIMDTTPSHFDGLNLPVESVSWNGAMEFCKRLTTKEHASGDLDMWLKYSLPTEAQWEYACRAGTKSAYIWGNAINVDEANFDSRIVRNGVVIGKSRNETTSVGSFMPNEWGLYDMHGNVWEWCLNSYSNSDLNSEKSLDESRFSRHILRGGSFSSTSDQCRSAYRYWRRTEGKYRSNGFRIVLIRAE